MNNALKKYRSICICLILALSTAAVYYQVCTYDFVNYDDPAYVYENPNIQSGFTLKAVKWAFSSGYASNWHPLTWLSHMLDRQLFGSNSGGHHLTNLIFHIANTLLLFVVLNQMTGRIWPSAFVAALFALHPLHVESVAWVAERKDVLSTFFWMLTMWAYVRFVSHREISSYLLIVVFFALGLMSKPMLVTLPFVLLLLDYWPLNRLGSRHSLPQLLIEKVPLFAMSIASCVVTFIVQQKGGTVVKLAGFPLKLCIYNAFTSYIAYIRKMIWPTRLAMFYPHPGQNISLFYVIISAVLLLTITILIFRFAGGRRYLVAGWLWYLGTLVPVIGIVQVGQQAFADRYTYITLTGLFIIIAWGLPELIAKWPHYKIALRVSALAVLSALAVSAHIQQRYWKNTETVCEHALKVTENNYEAHFCIAPILLEQGRIEEAIRHNTEAIRINPNQPKAFTNLGIALAKGGRIDEALYYFQKVLEMAPGADAHINLASALSAKGEFAEAVRHYRIALETTDIIAVRRNLGYALLKLGRFEEAAAEYRNVLSAAPDRVDIMNDLATAYAAAGDFSMAIETAEKALQLCQSPEQDALKEEIENRLALYKAGKPYIETQ